MGGGGEGKKFLLTYSGRPITYYIDSDNLEEPSTKYTISSNASNNQINNVLGKYYYVPTSTDSIDVIKVKNPPKFPFLKTDSKFDVITNRSVSEILKQDGSYKVVENGHYDNGFSQAWLVSAMSTSEDTSIKNSLAYLNRHEDVTSMNEESGLDFENTIQITSIPTSVKSIDWPYWGTGVMIKQ